MNAIPSAARNFQAFVNPTSVEILPAAEEHLPALAALAGVIWRQHYPGILSAAQIEYMLAGMYDVDRLRDQMRSQGVRFFRLLADGTFAGFASLGPGAAPDEWKLHKCYLLPAMHGRGYGSLLLQHCEREAARGGARRLTLTVNKGNPKAIRAYLRNGFREVKPVVTDIGGGFVMDDFVMTKELGA
jgi:GNAT superfamily N-acetyltransferase